MKCIKRLFQVGAFAAFLLTSANAAPLDTGIVIGFLAVQRYETDEKGNNIPIQDIFPGDLLIFTGKNTDSFTCDTAEPAPRAEENPASPAAEVPAAEAPADTAEEKPTEGEPGKPAGFITTVVVLDPTHRRHPMLVTIITHTEIPPGTRASIPRKGIKPAGFPCAPKEYQFPGVAITN